MGRDEVEQVWGCADYLLTARRLAPVARIVADRFCELHPQSARVIDIGAGHGSLAGALAERGHDVIAVEPVVRMRTEGLARTGGSVVWHDALGESTGLPGGSARGVVSNFGTFLCDPLTGPPEWAARCVGTSRRESTPDLLERQAREPQPDPVDGVRAQAAKPCLRRIGRLGRCYAKPERRLHHEPGGGHRRHAHRDCRQKPRLPEPSRFTQRQSHSET